jgi:hypothetical protein
MAYAIFRSKHVVSDHPNKLLIIQLGRTAKTAHQFDQDLANGLSPTTSKCYVVCSPDLESGIAGIKKYHPDVYQWAVDEVGSSAINDLYYAFTDSWGPYSADFVNNMGATSVGVLLWSNIAPNLTAKHREQVLSWIYEVMEVTVVAE